MGETVIVGGFEWDADKAAANLVKHGVSFDEAATVFASMTVETADPVDASVTLTVGFSASARILLVVSTELDGKCVRIISARRATRRERNAYDEG